MERQEMKSFRLRTHERVVKNAPGILAWSGTIFGAGELISGNLIGAGLFTIVAGGSYFELKLRDRDAKRAE